MELKRNHLTGHEITNGSSWSESYPDYIHRLRAMSVTIAHATWHKAEVNRLELVPITRKPA